MLAKMLELGAISHQRQQNNEDLLLYPSLYKENIETPNPLESSGPTSEAMQAFFEGSLTSANQTDLPSFVTMQDIDSATITLEHSPDRTSLQKRIIHDNQPPTIFKQEPTPPLISNMAASRQAADLAKYVDI